MKYMFKYSFRIKKSFLESLRSQKTLWTLELGKTFYKYSHLARIEFFRFFAALNESLRLVIIYYMFKYKFWIKTTLLESLRNQKSLLKARFRNNLLKGLSFYAKWLFKACWSSKWVPKNYCKTIYVQIIIKDENNFARVTSNPEKPFKGLI